MEDLRADLSKMAVAAVNPGQSLFVNVGRARINCKLHPVVRSSPTRRSSAAMRAVDRSILTPSCILPARQVVLSILDHFKRRGADQKRVVGTLLGEVVNDTGAHGTRVPLRALHGRLTRARVAPARNQWSSRTAFPFPTRSAMPAPRCAACARPDDASPPRLARRRRGRSRLIWTTTTTCSSCTRA